MKLVFAVLFAILVSGCVGKQIVPPPLACEGIENDCAGSELVHTGAHEVGGIPATNTVQLMVQSPMLIGGKPADPAEWPASVYARAGSSSCSATIIGERVVFIASHCVSNGGKISFSAHANQYTARCSHHPEYRGNSTADWALCLIDRPVTGVPFEMLGIDKKLEIKGSLLLSGYGCVRPGGGGGNDGIFRIGTAEIRGLPTKKNYDIVTRGGAALCFGDSGGAAYLLGNKSIRHIVAVNSRGDINTMSYLPAVFAGSFIDWAKTWATESNNVRLCGIHADALGCRSGDAEPQPDGKFEISAQAACVKGLVKKEYLSKKETIVNELKVCLEKF